MNDAGQSNAVKRPSRRAALATLIGGLFLGAGTAVLAQGMPGMFGGRHHHGFGGGDTATMGKRIEAMVRRRLKEVNASDAQVTQIAGIWQAAMTDMRPLREQHMQGRKASAQLLSQPGIDRNALESLRVQQMQLADAASKRFTQAIADAAEVLSPEQRAALAAGMMRHGRGGRKS